MKEHTNMLDYFKELSTHEDDSVRKAASKCMAIYVTPKWKSRTMRNLLADLSWALYEYIKAKKLIEQAVKSNGA